MKIQSVWFFRDIFCDPDDVFLNYHALTFCGICHIAQCVLKCGVFYVHTKCTLKKKFFTNTTGFLLVLQFFPWFNWGWDGVYINFTIQFQNATLKNYFWWVIRTVVFFRVLSYWYNMQMFYNKTDIETPNVHYAWLYYVWSKNTWSNKSFYKPGI